MNYQEAVLHNLPDTCPREIAEKQQVVTVTYYSFDERKHRGQVVINEQLVSDIEEIFSLILHIRFPVQSVIPISHRQFLKDDIWDDELSMQANNTSAFNYREIAGTDRLSNHARGQAIDINPKYNPFVKDDIVQPHDAMYDPERSGTLTPAHPVVKKFKTLGWTWGGDWTYPIDYQHFEKTL